MYPWQKYAFFGYLCKSLSLPAKHSANMRINSANMLCSLTFVYILLRCFNSKQYRDLINQPLILTLKNKMTMKKLNFWLLASLFVGSLAFTACSNSDLRMDTGL